MPSSIHQTQSSTSSTYIAIVRTLLKKYSLNTSVGTIQIAPFKAFRLETANSKWLISWEEDSLYFPLECGPTPSLRSHLRIYPTRLMLGYWDWSIESLRWRLVAIGDAEPDQIEFIVSSASTEGSQKVLLGQMQDALAYQAPSSEPRSSDETSLQITICQISLNNLSHYYCLRTSWSHPMKSPMEIQWSPWTWTSYP